MEADAREIRVGKTEGRRSKGGKRGEKREERKEEKGEEGEHGGSVICKSTCPENYIPAVMPPLNPISPPSTAATFLATCLMAVLQPSGYSVFHGRDTPIQLSLP